MLTIDQLEAYSARIHSLIPAIKRNEVAVTADDLAEFLNTHKKEDNILMLALVPHHGMGGSADAAQWSNTCGFFFLVKTDYKIKRDEYINIFKETQAVARAFVEQLVIDKADNYGCGMFAQLEEGSISADPVKALSQCNGFYVEFTFKSAM